jgi:hypothetical protein
MEKQAHRRMSFESSLQSATDNSSHIKDMKAIHKGIQQLHQIIRLIERQSTEDQQAG